MNLASVFDWSALEYPEKTAIVFGGKHFTYKQVGDTVNQIANALINSGIGRGDKVALSCPNLPYFPMVYYAVLKIGAVVVPLNVLLKAREIAYHLEDSEAKAYFCFEGTAELPMAQEGFKGFSDVESCQHMWIITADPGASSPEASIPTLGAIVNGQSRDFEMVQTLSDETAVILYTSGTTGFPKGAELSHSNLVMNALMVGNLFELKHNDVQIVTLPLFHTFGQTCQMNAGFSRGNTQIIIPKFSPETVFEAIQNEGGTIFCGVPTMYWHMLTFENNGKFDLEKITETLRIGVSGGASLPLEIIKGIEDKFKIPIVEGFGMSETSPVVTFNHLNKDRKPGSIGTPIWGAEAMVVDDKVKKLPPEKIGELVVRGHNLMKGYYNKPVETAAAFKGTTWFHTGDLAKTDEDGYFYIVDRVKDMIIRGGYNVYPREIEEVMMSHPAISLAAIIGEPHDQHGEEIKAYVVLNEGQNASSEDIISWAKNQMAAYKYPRVVEIVESLPMTATGKILKKELRKSE